MLDIKLIRENPEVVRKNLKRRNDPEKIKFLDELLEIDEKWRKLVAEENDLRQKRNLISKEIADLKKKKEPADEKIAEAEDIPNKIKKIEDDKWKIQDRISYLLLRIPNLLHESVPVGKDENDNKEIRKVGKAPKFKFKPKSHLEILEGLGLIDSEKGATTSGHSFFYLKGDLVLLDLALQKFALDFLTKKEFQMIEPPYMVNKKVYDSMIGDPFDFSEASYKIEGEELYLIPTSEYPLGSLLSDETINKKDLPIKLSGVSPSFRKEVGTHGKYSKGLFRMHQFNKVEQFVICTPKDSWKIHEEIQKNTEEILKKLGLHFRVVNVCTGDIGTKAAKQYDTEAWMADGIFREVGSNSNTTDYQSRRLNIKYRNKDGQAPKGFVHTLNNTAIATSRIMIAIVEQFQNKDGSVTIPKVLKPYMNGKLKLQKEKN